MALYSIWVRTPAPTIQGAADAAIAEEPKNIYITILNNNEEMNLSMQFKTFEAVTQVNDFMCSLP